MKSAIRSTIFVAALLASIHAHASSSPCDERGIVDGPLSPTFESGGFGLAHRACPREEVALQLQGRAIIETENFYGNLRGGAKLDASFLLEDQLEIFLESEVFLYQQVIQSFSASYMGLGDTSIGVAMLAFANRGVAVTPMLRFTLPTSLGLYKSAFPIGIELGVMSALDPLANLRLHGGLSAMTQTFVNGARDSQRFGIAFNTGAEYFFAEWISVVADLQTQMLLRDDLDRMAVGAGLRVTPIPPLTTELAVMVPLSGADRNLASFGLRVAYRFDE